MRVLVNTYGLGRTRYTTDYWYNYQTFVRGADEGLQPLSFRAVL
jgi:hypothetical protein